MLSSKTIMLSCDAEWAATVRKDAVGWLYVSLRKHVSLNPPWLIAVVQYDRES